MENAPVCASNSFCIVEVPPPQHFSASHINEGFPPDSSQELRINLGTNAMTHATGSSGTPEGSCWPGNRWRHRMWGGTFSDTSGSPSSLRPLADKELKSKAQSPGSYSLILDSPSACQVGMWAPLWDLLSLRFCCPPYLTFLPLPTALFLSLQPNLSPASPTFISVSA